MINEQEFQSGLIKNISIIAEQSDVDKLKTEAQFASKNFFQTILDQYTTKADGESKRAWKEDLV
ncbi:hypothetical protein [Candidatus Bandiella euplotis]|uniref:Uncharacterized protein n=1 Tax=Candidatus Bandiella euplotis TaxID=1664265 RepID=A0ABZ0UJ59_9RICK|nr:hypothetical protein [Candidatus Bandiella woodruffii]WPX96113.1 hypothetical protein Bandiella_00217 [Candidatus Bandiella woodruffii]